MKQGCLLLDPHVIAIPELFDAIIDAFTLIRQLEVNENTHILIVEHEDFSEVGEGEFLPFYDIAFSKLDDVLTLSSISAPFSHPNFCIKCQTKKETNTDPDNREENRIILLS